MKKLISALLIVACLSSYSQDDKKQVSDAVMDYFDHLIVCNYFFGGDCQSTCVIIHLPSFFARRI